MSAVKRVVGVFFLLVAFAAGANWMATPLYDNSSGEYPVWGVLNRFMAPAVALALLVNAARMAELRRSAAERAVTRRYLEVSLAFFLSILMTIWYCWNYIYTLFSENEPESVFLIHLEWWAFIDPLLVIVVGVTGAHLWRDGRANG